MPPAKRSLSPRKFFVLKAALFLLCLLPAVVMFGAVFLGELLDLEPPADPVEFLTKESGEQALRFLIITLAMTPLRNLTKWSSPIKLRRMFGLYVFFYALIHFNIYMFLDLQLDFSLVVNDIIERKYITVGFIAFLLLIPLAITSNKFLIKKMGAKKWTALHRAVYAIGLLGAVHFLWLKRGNPIEPLVYLLIICVLLAMRLPAARPFFDKAQQFLRIGKKPS
ncbi:MAG: sulfite oxidase heme-binding subunit YedZ [Gammaproteobacteria bacterium WSBS_2016_MAG_OTU1]